MKTEFTLLSWRGVINHLNHAILLLTVVFTSLAATAQVSGDYRSAVGGNWSETSTWDYYDGSGWGPASDYPGQNPGSGTVTIQNGHAVVLDLSPAEVIGSLVFPDGTTTATSLNMSGQTLTVSGNLVFGNPGGTNGDLTLTIGDGTLSCASIVMAETGNNNEDITIDLSTGTLTVGGDIAMTNSARHAITCSSTATINIGGALATVGTFTVTTATVNYNGAGDQSIRDMDYYNLGIGGGGVKTLPNNNRTISNNLTVNDATLAFTSTTNRTLTVNGTLSGTGTIDMSPGNRTHILQLYGVSNSIGTLTTGTAASTVFYRRSGDQNIFPSLNYMNLSMDGSGIKTLQGNTVVGATLTFNSCTLNMGVSDDTLTVWGNYSPNAGATFDMSGSPNHVLRLRGATNSNNGTFLAGTDNQKVYMDGDVNQTIPAKTYRHLYINNYNDGSTTARVKTIGGVITVDGNLNIDGYASSATTLQLGGSNFTVNGLTAVNADGKIADNNNGGTNLFVGSATINALGQWDVPRPCTFQNGLYFYGLTFNGAGTYTFNTNDQEITGDKAFAISTVSVAAGITLSNTNTVGTLIGVLSGAGNFTNATNALLVLTGANNPITLTGILDFSTNPNTVEYRYNGNQTIAGVAPSTEINFNNLIISGNRGTITLWNGGTIGISGTFSQTFTGGSYTATGSTIHFNGASDQSIPALRPSSPQAYNNLRISGGNTKTLLNSIIVGAAGVLTLDNAILELDNNNLTIANNNVAAIVGPFDASSMISTNGSGYVIKNALSAQQIWPIGSGGYYSPMTLSAIAPTSGTLSVRAVPVAVNPGYINKYWDVVSSATLTSATATFEYASAEANGASQIISYSPAPSPGTSWQSPPVNGISSFGTNTFTITGNNPFAGWWTYGYRTFFSYQTGDWDQPTTWTSDPSGTLQIGNSIPDINDKVVVLSGRTVSLTGDVATTNLEVAIEAGAFLDMDVHAFTSTLNRLSGEGTLLLASDAFPAATINTLVNAGGGTVEYYNYSGTDFTLPLAQTMYNNLTINTTGDTATLLTNLTLNGNLYVKQGTFRINDNTATNRLILAISGDVTVDNGGKIVTGKGVTNPAIGSVTSGGTAPFLNYYDYFHRVVIQGNMTNNGTVRFTNLDYPVYNAFPPTLSGATSGAASVYFQGAADKSLICNGITDFYNLVVDKGTDRTYKLTISSLDYQYFRLFGANTLDTDGAVSANSNLRKALWLRNGTVILEGELVIPSLTEASTASGNYYLPSNAALQLNGTDVAVLVTADDYQEINAAYSLSVPAPDNATIGITKEGNSALIVFGRLQMNAGYLSTRESAGLISTSTASGQILIQGGTVDAKQLRAATGSLSYTQTAGALLLRGRLQRTPTAYTHVSDLTDISTATLNPARLESGINTSFGTFNLEQTNAIFSMSGGTISIYDVTNPAPGAEKAFDVNSSSANYSVTGGTIEIAPMTGNDLADAADFLITSTAPLGSLTVNRMSGSSVVKANTYPLTLLNNLTVASGELDANNLDVTIGGNFSLSATASYLAGSNTTTFNGTNNQTVTVDMTSDLQLNNLTMNKPVGKELTFAGSRTTVNVADELRIEAGTLNDNEFTINVLGNVYNAGIHTGDGKMVLAGSAVQIISGDGNGRFGNLELNNTHSDAAPVVLAANITITDTLTFSQDKNLNISTYNLHFSSTAPQPNANADHYIISAGNVGDGGISRSYAASALAFEFPVGVADFTPATIALNSAPQTYGTITVVPVNYAHPNVTASGRSLSYFWRVKSSDFDLNGATLTHSYRYADANIVTGGDVTEDEYVAARFDYTAFTWSNGDKDDVDESSNTIGGAGTLFASLGFIDGDYTAGDTLGTAPFGAPKKYYSRLNGVGPGSGRWDNSATWSSVSHTGDEDGGIPGASDIVIIGGLDSVFLYTEDTNADQGEQFAATLQIEAGSALDIGYNPACVFSTVISHPNGNGNFRLTTSFTDGSTYDFPSGDFSDFNANRGTTELYSTNPNSGTTYWLPNDVSSYGNLILSPLGGSNIIMGNTDLTIYGDLITRGEDSRSWFCPTWNSDYPGGIARQPKTITIYNDFRIEGGAFIYYGNNALAQNIVVHGDLFINEPAGLKVYSNATNQAIEIGGSLVNNSLAPGSGVNGYRGAIFTSIPLTFFGDSNALITNTNSGMTPHTVFSTVTVNKGNSQATTLTCDIEGTLTTPTNNWLFLQNGTFRYMRNNPATDFTISTTTPFTISETAGLYIDYATTNRNVLISNANSNTSDLVLNGKLTLVNGRLYVGPTASPGNSNDIEYSGSGASEIDVQGGTLVVNGQIRRPLTTTNGVLKYKQSGGTVVINGQAASATYAKLEVLNPGSSFIMSGGTLAIVRGGGTTYGDLYLRPQTTSVTGGTILFSQIPPVGTTVDADQAYQIESNTDLYHLTVTGKTASTARNAMLSMMVSPLVLKGNLTLSNTRSFLTANNINVTIGGNLDNSGTYTYGTNLTTFNGSAQNITGTTTTNFYDLTVASASSLTASRSFTVNRHLTITNGALMMEANKITLLGDLTNNGSYDDDNTTGGISMSGTSLQQITGTGGYGRLEINNSAGVKLNNDVGLQNDLIMIQGVFDINQYRLTLGQYSDLKLSGSPYSVLKMIRTDGVGSAQGMRKLFDEISSQQIFTFPMGVTGKYTPAIFTINRNDRLGYIGVNPVNTYHPTVVDPLNVLQYYWQIESSGIDSLSGFQVLRYYASDVRGDENNYLAAKLTQPGDYWTKTYTVDPALHEITFYSTLTNNLTGDYTAGTDPAIPDQVPTYKTNAAGNWTASSIWDPVGHIIPCPPGGPNGCIVIIDHAVTTNANNSFAYRTTINDTLKVNPATFGHNLGEVDGDGVLHLESSNLPAGDYALFFDCSGNGTLEYGGLNTSYTINASLYNSVPNLSFTGTGTRILYNKDLSICKRLIIDGPVLDNTVNNRKLTILGTMERLGTGVFRSGAGVAPLATVSFAGNNPQTVGGTVLGDFTGLSSFYNLEINNDSGLTIGPNGQVEVANNLLLTNGLIHTSSTQKLTITTTASNTVTPAGGSSTSFINGPLTKRLNGGGSFLFPLGKDSIKGHNFTVTQAGGGILIYWTAEYFTPNSTSGSHEPALTVVNGGEYWTLASSANRNATVKIGWDGQSDLVAATNQNGISDMRVAESISNTWYDRGNTATSGTLYVGDVTSNSLPFTTAGKTLTTASTSLPSPIARFASVADVCGLIGIPLSFTTFYPINGNYILDYTINGNPQTSLNVSSLPNKLATPVEGVYRLTGFRFNSGANLGVADISDVNVYEEPTDADAGETQNLCSTSSATLEGNDPSPYSGLWSIVDGAGGNFINNADPETDFNGIAGESYTLRWTISNGSCNSSNDVSISFPVVAARPSNFTSAASVICRGTTGIVYAVPSVPGYTYSWDYDGPGETINGSSHSVTIDFADDASDGVLSVRAINTCGTSDPRQMNITTGRRGDWEGTSGSDWFETDNWACPELPFISTDVVIPASAANMPVINGPGAIFADLTIDAGAELQLAGTDTLHVYADWTNNGTFTSSATATVTFEGTTDIDGTGTNAFGQLVINGSLTAPSGNMNIAGNVTNNGAFDHNGGTVTFNGVSLQRLLSPTEIIFNNLTVNAGATLSVNPRSRVTVEGLTSINGNLTLVSGTSSTASFIDNGIAQAGNVTVERRLGDRTWQYLGLPVASVLRGTFFSKNFYYYDESQADAWNTTEFNNSQAGWINPMNGDLVANYGQLRGYAYLYTPSTLKFTGLLNTGVKSQALSYTNTGLGDEYDGWNLLCNPYPSAVDWDLVDKSDIEGAIYYYSDQTAGIPNTSNYATYISDPFPVSTNGGVAEVPQMQGFFVKALNTANGQLFGFDNSVRVHPTRNVYKTQYNYPYSAMFRIMVEKDSITDEAVVRCFEGATPGHDALYDGYKVFSESELVPQIYTLDAAGNRHAINSLPDVEDNAVIPVGIDVRTDGDYTITLEPEALNSSRPVWFVDQQTNISLDASAHLIYRVNLAKGSYKDRFFLKFGEEVNSVPEARTDAVRIYAVQKDIFVQLPASSELTGQIEVFDLTGRLLKSEHITDQLSVVRLEAASGIYVVKVQNNNQLRTERVYVKE